MDSRTSFTSPRAIAIVGFPARLPTAGLNDEFETDIAPVNASSNGDESSATLNAVETRVAPYQSQDVPGNTPLRRATVPMPSRRMEEPADMFTHTLSSSERLCSQMEVSERILRDKCALQMNFAKEKFREDLAMCTEDCSLVVDMVKGVLHMGLGGGAPAESGSMQELQDTALSQLAHQDDTMFDIRKLQKECEELSIDLESFRQIASHDPRALGDHLEPSPTVYEELAAKQDQLLQEKEEWRQKLGAIVDRNEKRPTASDGFSHLSAIPTTSPLPGASNHSMRSRELASPFFAQEMHVVADRVLQIVVMREESEREKLRLQMTKDELVASLTFEKEWSQLVQSYFLASYGLSPKIAQVERPIASFIVTVTKVAYKVQQVLKHEKLRGTVRDGVSEPPTNVRDSLSKWKKTVTTTGKLSSLKCQFSRAKCAFVLQAWSHHDIARAWRKWKPIMSMRGQSSGLKRTASRRDLRVREVIVLWKRSIMFPSFAKLRSFGNPNLTSATSVTTEVSRGPSEGTSAPKSWKDLILKNDIMKKRKVKEDQQQHPIGASSSHWSEHHPQSSHSPSSHHHHHNHHRDHHQQHHSDHHAHQHQQEHDEGVHHHHHHQQKHHHQHHQHHQQPQQQRRQHQPQHHQEQYQNQQEQYQQEQISAEDFSQEPVQHPLPRKMMKLKKKVRTSEAYRHATMHRSEGDEIHHVSLTNISSAGGGNGVRDSVKKARDQRGLATPAQEDVHASRGVASATQPTSTSHKIADMSPPGSRLSEASHFQQPSESRRRRKSSISRRDSKHPRGVGGQGAEGNESHFSHSDDELLSTSSSSCYSESDEPKLTGLVEVALREKDSLRYSDLKKKSQAVTLWTRGRAKRAEMMRMEMLALTKSLAISFLNNTIQKLAYRRQSEGVMKWYLFAVRQRESKRAQAFKRKVLANMLPCMLKLSRWLEARSLNKWKDFSLKEKTLTLKTIRERKQERALTVVSQGVFGQSFRLWRRIAEVEASKSRQAQNLGKIRQCIMTLVYGKARRCLRKWVSQTHGWSLIRSMGLKQQERVAAAVSKMPANKVTRAFLHWNTLSAAKKRTHLSYNQLCLALKKAKLRNAAFLRRRLNGVALRFGFSCWSATTARKFRGEVRSKCNEMKSRRLMQMERKVTVGRALHSWYTTSQQRKVADIQQAQKEKMCQRLFNRLDTALIFDTWKRCHFAWKAAANKTTSVFKLLRVVGMSECIRRWVEWVSAVRAESFCERIAMDAERDRSSMLEELDHMQEDCERRVEQEKQQMGYVNSATILDRGKQQRKEQCMTAIRWMFHWLRKHRERGKSRAWMVWVTWVAKVNERLVVQGENTLLDFRYEALLNHSRESFAALGRRMQILSCSDLMEDICLATMNDPRTPALKSFVFHMVLLARYEHEFFSRLWKQYHHSQQARQSIYLLNIKRPQLAQKAVALKLVYSFMSKKIRQKAQRDHSAAVVIQNWYRSNILNRFLRFNETCMAVKMKLTENKSPEELHVLKNADNGELYKLAVKKNVPKHAYGAFVEDYMTGIVEDDGKPYVVRRIKEPRASIFSWPSPNKN